MRPLEPSPTRWQFPCTAEAQATLAGPTEIVAAGADLEPGTLLAAYRCGLFPMPIAGRLTWWSPEPRAIIPLGALRVSRSLRRSCCRYEVRVDSSFGEVIAACADPHRPGGWISKPMQAAYTRLHELGWAHSVETWTADGQLAGGLYGLAIGGFFAGESMFHRFSDASKVALVALVELLRLVGGKLLDVQWPTPHLASLGALEVSRARYLELLKEALAQPQLCPEAGIALSARSPQGRLGHGSPGAFGGFSPVSRRAPQTS